jgi:hypothetical protein
LARKILQWSDVSLRNFLQTDVRDRDLLEGVHSHHREDMPHVVQLVLRELLPFGAPSLPLNAQEQERKLCGRILHPFALG